MPNATIHTSVHTISTGKQLFLTYLKANFREIDFRYIGNQAVPNTPYYGTNGVYYDGGSNLVSIALNNGNYIRSGGPAGYNGEQNRGVPRDCGTFIVLNSNISGMDCICDKFSSIGSSGITYNGVSIARSSIRLAVGGTSLYTGTAHNSMTQTQFYNAIAPEDPGDPTGTRPRTALIYTGGTANSLNTVLLTVFGDNNMVSSPNLGPTLWELRTLIREFPAFKLPNGNPPVQAINLDGGGSTQITYKDVAGLRKSFYADNGGGSMRNVQSMLCVTM